MKPPLIDRTFNTSQGNDVRDFVNMAYAAAHAVSLPVESNAKFFAEGYRRDVLDCCMSLRDLDLDHINEAGLFRLLLNLCWALFRLAGGIPGGFSAATLEMLGVNGSLITQSAPLGAWPGSPSTGNQA